MKKVGDIGEEELVARIVGGLKGAGRLVLGPGDDCGVVEREGRLELLKTDAVVGGVHFLAEDKPERVGWKAVARVFSDFAAMGGWPREILVTVLFPRETGVKWVEGLYAGISRCVDEFGAVVAGGETGAVPDGGPIVISIAGTGAVEAQQLVRRSGGKAGDILFVTGRLGGSIRGKHLDFIPRLEEAKWLVSNFQLTAMMDLSDGLGRDLPRLARASGTGFQLEEAELPCSDLCGVSEAVGDGEDYELLFSVGADQAARLEESWPLQFPDLELTRIGFLTNAEKSKLDGGWQHFSD